MLIGLQNLRALAAYAVVFFHLLENLNNPSAWYIGKMPIGAAGVDIFFVLSGFVMVYVTKESETPGRFIAKRIARIVPIYWLVSAVWVVLYIIAPVYAGPVDLAPQALINSFLFLPYFPEDVLQPPILIVGWTLNMEIAFYICFAISLFAPSKYRIASLFLIILGGGYACYALGQGTAWSFYGSTLIIEFLIGCLIALALKAKSLQAFWNKTPYWTFGIMACAGFVYTAFNLNHFDRLIGFGIPAALLVLAVAQNDIFNGNVKRGFVTSLGDASYSAYLIHAPLITMAFAVGNLLFADSVMKDVFIWVAVLSGTIVGAYISYIVIEKPMNNLLRRWML